MEAGNIFQRAYTRIIFFCSRLAPVSLEVKAFFESLEIGAVDAWTLFLSLDVDGDNLISIDEFMERRMGYPIRASFWNPSPEIVNMDTRYTQISLRGFLGPPKAQSLHPSSRNSHSSDYNSANKARTLHLNKPTFFSGGVQITSIGIMWGLK